MHADKYHEMLALADLFDASGVEMRRRSRLGAEILADDDVADSAELSPATFAQAEEDIRAATTGKQGLLTRSVELDADALVVRATVLTYRWIDELQDAAYKTLGNIAGRAIGYLAPEVALGGAIVSAGLIETDALDRDGVATYLNELAESNPELMDHMAGVGGLLDGLQMRSLLAAGVMSTDQGAAAARGGLRAIGVQPFASDAVAALRDSAAGFAEEAEVAATTDATAERDGRRAAHHRGPDDQPGPRRPPHQRAAHRGRALHRLPPRPTRRRGRPAAAGRRRQRVVRPPGRAGHRERRRRRARGPGHARRLLRTAAPPRPRSPPRPRRRPSSSTRSSPPAPPRRRCRPSPRRPGCCPWRTAPTRSPCSAR